MNVPARPRAAVTARLAAEVSSRPGWNEPPGGPVTRQAAHLFGHVTADAQARRPGPAPWAGIRTRFLPDGIYLSVTASSEHPGTWQWSRHVCMHADDPVLDGRGGFPDPVRTAANTDQAAARQLAAEAAACRRCTPAATAPRQPHTKGGPRT